MFNDSNKQMNNHFFLPVTQGVREIFINQFYKIGWYHDICGQFLTHIRTLYAI